MNVLIVSGFLGCGKTTFIRELIKRTGKSIAVFENEYGTEGIDADILKNDTSRGTLNIWEMTEGCICCSTSGDFVQSVLTIANTVDPDYLVVEPSGVAMLPNLISSLQQIEYERIKLLAPLTIVDADNFLQYQQDYEQIVHSQISGGANIVFSKSENIPEEEMKPLVDAVRKLNPDARIYPHHYKMLSNEEFWDPILKVDYRGQSLEPEEGAEDLLPDSCSFKNVRMKSPAHLLVFLDDMVRGQFGNIVRSKGIFKCGEETMRYDLVGTGYSVIGTDEDSDHKVVFIGHDLNRKKLLKRFELPSVQIIDRRAGG